MVAEAGAGAERPVDQVGARQADHVAVLAERVGRAQDLRHRRAHAHQRHRRAALRAPQRIAAGQHELAPLVRGVVARQRLVDRARGEPEVGRLAVRPPEPRQRVEQRPLEVLAEGRLPEGAARLADADRRRDDRLVRPSLRRERDARRRADQDRLPARVDPERPRLERAAHERVVDRADREERLAVAAPGGAELAQQARPGSSPRCRARCGGRPASRASARASANRRRTSRAARRPTRSPTC